MQALLNNEELQLEMDRWGMTGIQYPDEVKINLRNRNFRLYLDDRFPAGLNVSLGIAYASLLGALHPTDDGGNGAFMLCLWHKRYSCLEEPLEAEPVPAVSG